MIAVRTQFIRAIGSICLLCALVAPVKAGERAGVIHDFIDRHCVECHDADTKKGGLDLTALKLELDDSKIFAEWVKVHDRVRGGEMPPKKKPRPDSTEIFE